MKLNFSKPTKFEWIALCFFLACVALMSYAFYSVSWALRWQSLKPGMYREVHADIIDPLESKFNITDKEWKYRDCSIKLPPDDTIMLGIRLDPKDGEKMFDIARDVYELKRKSPVLHKKPLELEIRVRDPKSGVNFHAYMPGAPGHKKKPDLEEYQELTRKWEEILWQEEMDKRRAAAGNSDKRGENDSAPQQTPQ
jgi:hypothetical protein